MNSTTRDDARPDQEHVAMLALRALSAAQVEGRRVDLEELSRTLGVRRAELRATLSGLHRQGLVDVMRMRVTLRGFALGRSIEGQSMAPLRRVPAPPASRAA